MDTETIHRGDIRPGSWLVTYADLDQTTWAPAGVLLVRTVIAMSVVGTHHYYDPSLTGCWYDEHEVWHLGEADEWTVFVADSEEEEVLMHLAVPETLARAFWRVVWPNLGLLDLDEDDV